jgi:hypothetical protein
VAPPRPFADVGDHRALVTEQRLGDGPALVDLAHHLTARHADVVEERLAERRIAADELDRLHADAGARHVHEQEADALVLGRVGVRAHEEEHPVGLIGVRRPHLLSGDDEVVALEHGARLQAREIGAGAGLRVALAPADLAADDRRDVRALELLGAELEQRRSDHRQAETDERWAQAHRGHLLREDARLLLAQAAAAVGGRPGGRGPAARRHHLEPALDVGTREGRAPPAPARLLVLAQRRRHRLRSVGFQPGARLAPERFEISHAPLSNAIGAAVKFTAESTEEHRSGPGSACNL